MCHGPNGEGYKADQATALAHPQFLASASDEPFDGLFTQGMVLHETYRAADGTWTGPPAAADSAPG